MGKTENHRHWLVAIRAPALGGRKLIDLVEAAGGIENLAAFAVSGSGRNSLDEDTVAALRQPDEELIESDLRWLDGANRHLVTWADEDFPPQLRRIPSPPAALFLEGDPGALWQPQIAIIGSRNPTVGGLDHARSFGAEFCRVGMTVTSGMASGIDSAAHTAALEAGGQTVAVTGTGLDRVYPASSAGLAREIAKSGALVSELPLGSPPKREHFPSRNRIISGLSLGVLVIEAGLNSGTLITARQAAEQGKEVFALPGSLHNPMAKGCHRLIREGARLVETVNDVMSELAPMAGVLASELRSRAGEPGKAPATEPPSDETPDDPEYAALLAAMEHDPRTVDELSRLTGLPVRSVSSMLLMLELRGRVLQHSSGRFLKVR